MKKSVFMAFIASVCLITSACSGQGTGVSVTSGEATTVETTEAVKNTEKPTEIETEPETKEYTAVELASKNLDEIKTIMGDNYKSEHVQLSNAFSSSGTPYIYNYDVLPGFAFATDEEDYYGISIMDGAKLNDQISSDMTYNQIADIIGDMEGGLVGQENNIACSNVVDGYNVTFCFIENDYIRNNKASGGKISSDVLKGGDPELQSIGLRREPTVKATEQPIYETTKAPSTSDYSSYLGVWSYKDTHEMKTTLNFQEINGINVKFELSKGNNINVADTIITGEIVDGVIDFEYIDGWGSIGHGTITLNENSVHVFCVQDESNTYKSPAYRGASLACDETLTRQ